MTSPSVSYWKKNASEGYNKIKKALHATVKSIALLVETKDPYTAGHQERVSQLAKAIAKEMGFTEDRQDFVSTASIIHDLGKSSVPSELLEQANQAFRTGIQYH